MQDSSLTAFRDKKGHLRRPKAIVQALAMQDVAYELATNGETAPSVVAQLMRAWSELEERKRILKMKPKPKDLDVSKGVPGRRRKPIDAAGPISAVPEPIPMPHPGAASA